MVKINFGGKSVKEKKNIFLGLLIAASLLLTIGCDLTGADDGNGGGGITPTAVTFESAEQTGGTSGTADSTGLTLTFDVDPTTLAASDITVTGATKGALSGTGLTRTLAISDITVGNGETVSVAITSPSGYDISGSPQTAVVYKVLYAIGDTGPSGVGIVFYVTDGGLHGLEAAPADQSTGAAWITGGDTRTTENGNTLTGIGTGSANTDAIIAQTGHTASAAQICRDYRAAEEGDWFLPSRDELDELYQNRVSVGGFASMYYWSSSELSSDAAWAQYFDDGAQFSDDKFKSLRVRAVRAF
jgi:hypothetical protein